MRTKTEVLVYVLGVVFAVAVAISFSIRRAWGFAVVGTGLAVIVIAFVGFYFASRRQLRAAAKEILGFDPRDQNVADGVIASFVQLRTTRTELINGYSPDAPRISLHGLSATVEDTADRVQVTVEGPGTKLAYGVDAPSAAVRRQARAFTTVLNVTSNKL
jgi:hypothetical protein